jgi:DNA-binding transcriptional MerR regulator
MPDENAPLAIGELARQTGSATSALRYYERIGLLPPAERAGGRRHYPREIAERIALIRLYQDAGFTLAEIRELLADASRRRGSWRRLAERKIDELDARIAEAQYARRLLEHALGCSHRDLFSCPNFLAALHTRLARGAASGRDDESGTGAPKGAVAGRGDVSRPPAAPAG